MAALIFLIVSFFCAIIHIMVSKKKVNSARAMEIISLYLIVIMIGVGGMLAFIGNVFFPQQVAEAIGWSVGGPFQHEVGMMDLSLGVLGFMSIFFRGKFWLATAIAQVVFLLGTSIFHIFEIHKYGELANYDYRLINYVGDFISPIVIFTAVIIYYALNRVQPKGK